MKTVSIREANQSFSRLLKHVESGEDVVVTRRGTPVARIVSEKAKSPEEKARAKKELMDMLRQGFHLGENPMPSRDELHER